jgi:hypothetical protein
MVVYLMVSQGDKIVSVLVSVSHNVLGRADSVGACGVGMKSTLYKMLFISNKGALPFHNKIPLYVFPQFITKIKACKVK